MEKAEQDVTSGERSLGIVNRFYSIFRDLTRDGYQIAEDTSEFYEAR